MVPNGQKEKSRENERAPNELREPVGIAAKTMRVAGARKQCVLGAREKGITLQLVRAS